MADDDAPTTITITRSTIVRVRGDLDAASVDRLRRVLDDLIDGHGITDFVVDLSDCAVVDHSCAPLLAIVRRRLSERGGLLELRLPTSAPRSLADLADEVPTFTPLPSE